MMGGMRTRTCGELRESHVGEDAVLCGWVNKARDLGGLRFLDLRDKHGLTQLNLSEWDGDGDLLKRCHIESVVRAEGAVRARPPRDRNPSMATGAVEVAVTGLELLSPCDIGSLPFLPHGKTPATEELRLRHRYLDLRSFRLQETLALRSRAAMRAREALAAEGFVEVETPILYKPTPEGARDYVVPSRLHPGSVYALPQSPQTLKQLLMVGGTDRYFQICRCFRDEDLRADRGAEFTQIDIEASFVGEDDIKGLAGRTLAALFGTGGGLPMEEMTHAEAMRDYGTDKPDLRFGLRHADATDAFRGSPFRALASVADAGGLVKAMFLPAADGRLSRKGAEELARSVEPLGGKGAAFFRSEGGRPSGGVAKFVGPGLIEDLEARLGGGGDGTWVLVGDRDHGVAHACADAARRHLGRELGLIDQGARRFVWVGDFPLFEWDAQSGRLEARHHPFTAPREDALPAFLEKDGEALADLPARAYDVVCNGHEIGGGSVRIHRPDVQERMFRLLGMDEGEARRRFGFFVDALRYGTPPHAGIALGFDRIVMILAGADSMRDVVAFPKTTAAADLMAGAPSPPSDEQVRELSFRWL